MYNAIQIKKNILAVAFVLTTGAVCSCGGPNDEANALFAQAEQCYAAGDYNQSNMLLDSLKKNYTDDIDLLKKGLHLRTLNQEGLILAEMASTDSLLSVLEVENQQLSGDFKYIKHKDMVEGYYIHKTISDKAGDDARCVIEPRIDESDMFYIVSFLKGQSVDHTHVKIKSRNGEVSTRSVPYDGARNYRYKSGGIAHESITFMNAECDTIGCFITNNSTDKHSLVFAGKKQYSVNVDAKMQKAIAETYRYATNKKQGKSAIKKKMYLEQKLQLAQKQIEQTKPTK